MPIQVITGSFIDAFGVQTTQYKSNAGDELIARFEIRSQIRMSSIGNPLTLDPSQNVVTSPQVSWLEEGFRVGDVCRATRYNSGGGIMASWYTTINYVDDIICDFGAMPQWYSITNNQFIVFYALDLMNVSPPYPSGFYTPRPRNDLDVLINHAIGGNGTPASSPSLIDGENSRAIFFNLATLGVGGSVLGTFVGNQSGQFFKSCEIRRNADNPDRYNTYTIDVVFANSGMYDETWFATINNLKFFMQLLWASIPSDPYPRAVVGYDEEANTGWFNSPNEISVADSTLIQGITELDYCVPTTHEVVVDGVITDIGIGACYTSTNDLYYRNRVQNQYPITMLVPTSPVFTLPLLTSPTNEFNASYEIQINSVVNVGSQTTINFTFTPNIFFNAFMAGVDDGDRLFYLWIKCGNINHLVFQDQLTCEPPVGGILPMESDYGFLDHSQNVDEIIGDKTGFEANTEDDIAYFGTFLLEKFEEVDSFNVKIEAYNTTTFDDFTLIESNFGFGGVQISGDGRYLLNESQNVVTTLPSNSLKQNAKLYLYPSLDAGANYGVAIYYPFLLNWKYWLQQNNANVAFYPTQDKNWEQYDNLLDWQLRIEISAIKGGLAFTHSNVFIDKDYDSDANVIQNIELYIDSTNQNVGIVTIGQLMRIVATHELVVGAWDQLGVWGMVTVEPCEAEKRYICSSVLPFDNDLSNPLKPLDNVQMIITYPAPNVARMECFFDPDLIDLSNGCKFTTKIKQLCDFEPPVGGDVKQMTDGTTKTTTTGDDKTTAP
jgi:hypothetical protein